MINVINGETPFQILSSSFSIGPSETGYDLQVGADSRNFTTLFSVGANTPRMVTNVANGSYFRLKNNVGDVKVNWQRVCTDDGGGGASGTELSPVSEFPLGAEAGTVIAYTGSSSASGVYQYDGNEWTEVGADIDLSGYATSGDMQSAFTLISETQRVAAAGLNQLEGRIDELSGATPDLSAYWTSAETQNAIDEALSAYTPTSGFSTINGSAITNGGNIVISDPDVSNYVTSAQVETQIVEKNYVTSAQVETQIVSKNYITSADTANFVTSTQVETQILEKNYVTSAQVETQIEAKNYVNSGDVKSQVEAYNYATVSQIPTVPTSNTAFTNDAGYITDAAIENLVTSAQVETQITSKGYATVSQIPTVPTSNTAFTNDAGYITSASIADKVSSTYVSTIWRGTAAEYDAITTKDPDTFYIIVNN